ncbi:MAG: (Fe-S)-binding protein [Acidimicrobiales bacterium]
MIHLSRMVAVAQPGGPIVLRMAIGLVMTVVALAIAGRRLFFLTRLVASGKPDNARLKDIPARIRAEFSEVVGQRKLFKRRLPGLAHAMTFWGFIILMFTIIEAYGDLFSRKFAIPIIGHSAVLGFLEDFFSVSILVALAVFAIIRLKHSPARKERGSRFFGSHTNAAWYTLFMIALVVISLLYYRGAQTNVGEFPYGRWAFASHIIGRAFSGLGRTVNGDLVTAFLLLNISVIMAFLVFVTYSKHLHIFMAPVNVITSRRPRALGPLYSTPSMDMEEVSEDTVFGAGHIEDFSWKQLLDLLTCTECGRCQAVCPAWNTGKPLSPKLVIMSLRENLFQSAPRVLAKSASARSDSAASPDGSGGAAASSGGEVEAPTLVPATIDTDVLWSCLTCGACVEECPVDIEHVDTIVDMRRYEVLMESRFPQEAGLMLRNIENQGDPWGLGGSKRTDWIASLDFDIPVIDGTIPDDVEYLYWVGCAGALDERARKATQAIARMMHHAGVKFAILGPRESCTGDPARRMGNEYLFQEQAKANVEALQSAGVKKIVTSCPHCFNSIAREYPALGGNFEVIHHSQLFNRLVRDGKLIPGKALSASVTYHDPCYLGRHNRVFDEPRDMLDAIPGVRQIEMERHREGSFCCGAGGARMWMEESIGKRVNMERTDEALSTGADVVSTACPYCLIMIDDAVKANQKEDEVKVLDLAQIMEASLKE